MQQLDRASKAAFSVFANDVERLPVRMAAAKALSESLASIPDSKVQGPLRTAMIKCDLASRYCETHSQVDDRFCEVSELVHQAHRKK